MSYTLVYSERGHELSTEPLESLSAINERIHHLHNTSHVGITVLRIEEHQDGPRTWTIEYPPAPPAGTRVRAKGGMIFTVKLGGRTELDGVHYTWADTLEEWGPLTEVVETEVEAAARRLRERGLDRLTISQFDDITTVLRHVLNGGQLPEVK